MKAAKAYLLFAAGWALALWAAVYGWGQDFAPARHIYGALLILSLVLQLLLVFGVAMSFVTESQNKPKPIERYFTVGFNLTSLIGKLFLFAWFGGPWMGVAGLVLGLTGMFIAELHNAAFREK